MLPEHRERTAPAYSFSLGRAGASSTSGRVASRDLA
jgi:hypothetical protein